MNHTPVENRPIPPFISTDETSPSEREAPRILDTEDYSTYGVTKSGERSLSLKVEFKNGIVAAFSYSRLGGPIFYDGDGQITLPTGTGMLNISGENVLPLLDYLSQQRLAWIREAHRNDLMLEKSGETLVKTIIYNSEQ